MAELRARRRWLTLAVFAVVVYVIVRAADTPQAATPPSAGASRSASSTGSASPSASATASSYDPAAYASQVRTRAQQAHVSAQLVIAILYNEAYKPHDAAFERAWQKYKPDAAFGIANMHRATFDEVKKGRDFAGRRWDELPDDRDLAIEAEAWYLHDLAEQLPPTWHGSLSKDELLALGYNTGASNMLAFARGATPGSQAQSYLSQLHTNWAKAGKVVGG
ncbi:lytic transglycosylase domain-containing protein [Streptomyces sp. NBC_00988]|uniref:lytic transglycosylase domain-containing protein n=1 Tax=unclassified Streptomyces TaxID=2593676 RepID=UPI002E372BE5|nr:lytic transglycosylase domain-containing protein [Streptomyces sp. NBC_00696]WSX15493.1 lytic transglycosylase domain-containing protein [Streptomyces sp. NBC_00988]